MVRLVLTGQLVRQLAPVAMGLSSVLVIAAITLLFRNLYSKEVRSLVWNSPPFFERNLASDCGKLTDDLFAGYSD